MKWFLKSLFCMFAFCICICLIAYSGSITESQIRFVGGNKKSTVSLQYHFVIIAQDINEAFWYSVKSGAEKAGQKYKAAIELDGPVIQDENDELNYMNIAIASNVDGIVLYVTDKSKFTPLINKAVQKGIHVVTIESDDKSSKRNAYIGPNSYGVGMTEGSLARKSCNSTRNVALMLGGNYAENSDASASLLSGFKHSISAHLKICLKTVQKSNSGYFGAEKIIRKILYDSPEINTVVCTNSNDTLEVVQVLIDLNKISGMTVIGYGNSEQIRDYIKNNDIYASVYETPQETGFKSIENLAEILRGKPVPSVTNTRVYTILQQNLADK